MPAPASRCINMRGYHGRLVRIPVRRQRAHQPGQILALDSPLYCSRVMAAVILFTAAGIAAPFFIIMVVVVLIPWLLWGFSITTERLHDRDKSAWWLVVFYLVPGVLSQLAKAVWFAGATGAVLHYTLALASFALTIWGFVEIGCLRGTTGSNTYGPDPLLQSRRRS
jgi:uncharacterized membrane protein YhaH (DUF805 family)